MTSDVAEKFVRWFLRFNGYFSIENFIVHDSTRIKNGAIGNITETDLLSVRFPNTKEIIDNITMEYFLKLIKNQNGRIDVIISESKTGSKDKPNGIWINKNTEAIKYIIRFIGLFKEESIIENVSLSLSNKFTYEDQNVRIRLIMFSEQLNKHYNQNGLSYILYNEIVNFFVHQRNCWQENDIGIRSIHYQWDTLINDIYVISNDINKSKSVRVKDICHLLELKVKA